MFKKIFQPFFVFLFIASWIYWWFLLWKELVIRYLNLTNFSDPIVVVNNKEIKEKIQYVILWKYVYLTDKEIYDYKKEWKKIIIKKIKNLTIKRTYTSTWNKIDKLYDFFVYSGSTIDIRIDKMNQYNFEDFLEQFNIAPYYDKKNNTLYIFAHSSWKLYNIWLIFYKMKVWQILTFYDIKSWISDKYKIIDKKIVPKKEFYDNIFLNEKNKIIFATCYPFNSTKKRLYLILEKVNN